MKLQWSHSKVANFKLKETAEPSVDRLQKKMPKFQLGHFFSKKIALLSPLSQLPMDSLIECEEEKSNTELIFQIHQVSLFAGTAFKRLDCIWLLQKELIASTSLPIL